MQVSADFQVVRGPGYDCVRVHIAVNADVVAFDKGRDVAEVAAIECKVRFELVGFGRGRPQIPVGVASQCSESMSGPVRP